AGHTVSDGKRASRVAGSILRLSEDRVCGGVYRLNDHVICFSDRDPELIDRYRLHVIAVGLHYGHPQTRYADIEDGHRRGIDKTETNSFTRPEDSSPIGERRLSIEQIRVVRPADIENIGRTHVHAAPHQAVR